MRISTKLLDPNTDPETLPDAERRALLQKQVNNAKAAVKAAKQSQQEHLVASANAALETALAKQQASHDASHARTMKQIDDNYNARKMGNLV